MTKKSYLTATDQFCGAGGSSIGATRAGVELRLGLNHWKLAIETHSSNFPNADHECTDISACDPRRYPSTDILITSPECTNHTLAKGKARKYQQQLDLFGKATIDPAEERSRATMWDVPRFAEHHRYNIIIVENVVDARYWALWDAWLHAMDLLGYNHHIVYFNNMFAWPTPQSRDRMYIVFWRKSNPAPDLDIRPLAHCAQCGRNVNAVQVWKKPHHRWGRYRKQYLYCCPQCESVVEPYYYCAANAIDWSLPVQRIGDRNKPLKEKTLARIRIGLEKFGRQPLITDFVHSGHDPSKSRPVTQAWPTQIGNVCHALITPFMVDLAYTHARNDHNRSTSIAGPMVTQTSRQTSGLVVPPFLVDLRGENAPKELIDALSTVCATGNHHGLVMPFLASYYGTGGATGVDEAVPTVTSHDRHAVVVPPFLLSLNHSDDRVRPVTDPHPTMMPGGYPSVVVPPFLVSYYTRLSGLGAAVSGVDEPVPTQPTWPVHYLAQPGETPAVEDCGFRMLQPHEIHKAQAFPEGYIVLGNAREKVKQYGNANPPPSMELLIKRCVATLN